MKKKIIPLIISAVIFLSGLVTTIIGIAHNNGTVHNYPELDLFSITDEDVGKTFTASVYSDVMYADDTENGSLFLMWIYSTNTDDSDMLAIGSEDDDSLMVIGFDVPKSFISVYEQAMSTGEYSEDKPLIFSGTVRRSNNEITQILSDGITDYYNYLKEIYGDTSDIIDEDAFTESYESISPYYIEIIPDTNGTIYVCIGCAVMAVALLAVLAILFGRRFLIVFAVVIVLPVIILLMSLIGKFRTMASVTEVSDGLYTMTCHYNYKGNEFINADISTIDEFIEWAAKEHFFGLPIELDESNFGCSAFTAATPEGQRLFGRNFDYDETDTLVFYTEPNDGYASYGVTDLKFFDIGTKNGLDGNSIPAKALMLAAPYATMDGINEAGVGVGILQLNIDELHQDNGKSDLLIFAAIRGILDNCASVDEAIELLDNYDIHSFLDRSYHLFITDKTGRSVIVEWTDDETFIIEDTACTNDVMSNNEFYDPDWSCKRYDIIKKWLAEKNDILTEAEAMAVASDASKSGNKYSTQWSCVYNLDEFTIDICLDREYESVYSFTKEDFS
ncbi:MAG: linear amide C-N hydrolase [Oscillospiraceae bacterium]|nr:linear amide C-N hydrolase [Oscillospiraceae bacterium]